MPEHGAALPESADQRIDAVIGVRAHADKLKARLAADGKLPSDEGGEATAGMPVFATSTTQPDAPPPAQQAAVPDFKAETVVPDIATAPAGDASAAAAPAAAPDAATAAADAAAQQVIDEELWEFEDPDLRGDDGSAVKIPLKFPKQYSQTIKRAFPRRADYDRLKTRWGEAAPVLEPLLQDGRIRNILPLIQQALSDPTYGEYVWSGYQRAQQGLPLQVQQAIQQAQAQAQPQAPALTATLPEGDVSDPWLEKYIADHPRFKHLDTLEQKLQAFERQRDAEQQQQRETQQQQAALASQLQAAHADLAVQFPGEFNPTAGPNDPGWTRAIQFAKDYGYVQTYGPRAGVIFGYHKWKELEAERLAATASPAAQALQQVDMEQAELARRQAVALAAPGAAGATQASVPSVPMPKPSRHQADGKTLKSSEQYLAELKAWHMQAGGGA